MEDPPGMSKPAATEAVFLPPAEIRRLQTRLLDWYQRYRRQLPWRQSRDFYPVWVSEVMLQQTQVQTVVPYFLRFMKAFPTLEDLAGADAQHLLRIWAGLGYYSRAGNLQEAARMLVSEHGGKFPRSYREALRLPGIGPYTAARHPQYCFRPAAGCPGWQCCAGPDPTVLSGGRPQQISLAGNPGCCWTTTASRPQARGLQPGIDGAGRNGVPAAQPALSCLPLGFPLRGAETG